MAAEIPFDAEKAQKIKRIKVEASLRAQTLLTNLAEELANNPDYSLLSSEELAQTILQGLGLHMITSEALADHINDAKSGTK